MNAISLPDAAAESSVESCSDTALSVPSKSNHTAEKSSNSDKPMEACPHSQSMTMCEPSTASRGVESPMSSAVAFHAKTSQVLEKEQASKANEADCGPKCAGSLARYNPSSRSWKTAQCSLFGGLVEFSETWPEWGMTQDGEFWALSMPAHLTKETESGFWPTPRKSESNEANATIEARKARTGASCNDNLHAAAERRLGKRVKIMPNFVEWLMGWPIGWTDLQPLETDKFRSWQQSHGKPLSVASGCNAEVSGGARKAHADTDAANSRPLH